MSGIAFLDSRAGMQALDPQNALGSIEMVGSQIQQVWKDGQAIQIKNNQPIKNVVVAGMGGSVLGTHAIQTIFKEQLKVPVLIVPDYELPSFVNAETLVVTSSYSGTTEETLAAAADAVKKDAQIAGITSGGKLGEFLKSGNYPALIFDPVFNPSNSPRMALGYSIFGQMVLFNKLGLLSITETEYQQILEVIADAHLKMSVNISQEQNPAKLLAFEMLSRIPIITVAEHLEGMAHVFANQLNENAKTFAEFRTVPELNHHLMEGLQFPELNISNLLFVTAQSDLYLPGNQKRIKLTEEVIEQNHLEYRQIKLQAATKLTQAFEFLMMGAYTSFYLAMLHNQNPVPNPWVDWFKAELKK